ncbi:hypothetical protein B0H10DRAFT_1994944 [Mycena sp. CBHHK59/15]|nr:hypothetical protein B0H10DRAFT_1994944 [Mycena sp. CBHHK59/15]
MPERTRYVQPFGSPTGGYPYVGTSSGYPSPTYTVSSSLSASPGMTPPPMNHSRSLYACAPLPAINGHIHDALRAHSRPRMAFDVSYDPAYTVASSPVLSSRVLAEAATSPCLPCVSIISDLLPWRIDIHPSSSKPGAYVTVADVLNGIYHALRHPLSGEELAATPAAIVPSIRQAFHSRCSRLAYANDPTAAKSEARRGIRRIDFLLGNHQFVGLLSTSQNPDVWKLVVSS